MSDVIDELYQLLQLHIKNNIKPSIVWATVKSVDWDSKTMVATGLIDDLDYEDVLLGLGSYYRYPNIGSKCLLGVIEGKISNVFLIESESFKEDVTTSSETVMQVKENGFVFKKGQLSLRSELSGLIDEINNLNLELQKVVVSVGVTPDVPSLTLIKEKVDQIKSNIEEIIIE